MPCQIAPAGPIIPAMMSSRKFCLVCVLLAALTGCVQRDMTITSTPEGALVRISDREVGRTPVTIPFTWYGDYEIILRLDGHETRFTHANIVRPWYEVPPVDLFSELAPWTYHDKRYLHFTLEPKVPTTEEELIARAEELARRNQEPVKEDAPDDGWPSPDTQTPGGESPDAPEEAPILDDPDGPGFPEDSGEGGADALPEFGPTGEPGG